MAGGVRKERHFRVNRSEAYRGVARLSGYFGGTSEPGLDLWWVGELVYCEGRWLKGYWPSK